jgi:hypothetical protein
MHPRYKSAFALQPTRPRAKTVRRLRMQQMLGVFATYRKEVIDGPRTLRHPTKRATLGRLRFVKATYPSNYRHVGRERQSFLRGATDKFQAQLVRAIRLRRSQQPVPAQTQRVTEAP